MPYFVYELIDPRTDEIRYVGCTNQNPKMRLKQHLSESKDRQAANDVKKAWLQELLAEGLGPKIRVIETVESKQKGRTQERYWIRTYLERGDPLTNIDHTYTPHKKTEAQGQTPFQRMVASFYYTTREAQEVLGLSQYKFDQLLKIQDIGYFTFLGGKRRYYRRREIDSLVQPSSL